MSVGFFSCRPWLYAKVLLISDKLPMYDTNNAKAPPPFVSWEGVYVLISVLFMKWEHLILIEGELLMNPIVMAPAKYQPSFRTNWQSSTSIKSDGISSNMHAPPNSTLFKLKFELSSQTEASFVKLLTSTAPPLFSENNALSIFSSTEIPSWIWTALPVFSRNCDDLKSVYPFEKPWTSKIFTSATLFSKSTLSITRTKSVPFMPAKTRKHAWPEQ